MQFQNPVSHHRGVLKQPRISPQPHQKTLLADKKIIKDMSQILQGKRAASRELSPNRRVTNNPKLQASPTVLPYKIPSNNQSINSQFKVTQQNRKVIQTNSPSIPLPKQVPQPINPERRYQEQYMVFCPVCECNYSNSSTKLHVQRHLQPDPLQALRVNRLQPIITQILALPNPVPRAQTQMIVEPAEYFIGDDFGGNNFYVIDNAQNLPQSMTTPQSIVRQDIPQELIQPTMIPGSMHSVRQTQQSVLTSQDIIPQSYQLHPNFIPSQSLIYNQQNFPRQSTGYQSVAADMNNSRISNNNAITSGYLSNPVVQIPVDMDNTLINPFSNPIDNMGEPNINMYASQIDPSYPVNFYPLKKATTFNFFSCLDTIGHDSFHADSVIRRNDFYTRPR